MTHRLDRRLAILRGKREGAFDTDQYYLERAERARVARKARCLLRAMRPLVLVTPRWSQPRRFLDDVAVDLLLGEPAVHCRTLSLQPLEGRTPHQAWAWLVQAITSFCEIEPESAWQVVDRHGFRSLLKELLERADATGERRCLMIHALEHLHVEALRDLMTVFEDHVYHRTGPASFNLALAGTIDAPHFEFAEFERLVLPDFAEQEAVEALVEHLGTADLPRLRALVELVGGVPAVLDALGTEAADRIGDLIADRGTFWRTLGSLAIDIRRAFDIVAADDTLSSRLEFIARHGPQPPDPERDEPLVRAGLVRQAGSSPTERRTSLRAPVFADLAAI